MRPQVISFKCVLKNKAGMLISQTYNRDVLTSAEADHRGALPGLGKNLQNLKRGELRQFTVMAEEAYGLYDPSKVILMPSKKIPAALKRGELVKIANAKGAVRTYRVIDFHGDLTSLDGNHPLAGQDLVFEIEALDARDATPKEIADSLNPVCNQLLH
jgi:FKBP-type peptidyl-prolyl cis-trans isomerase SlyD